MTLWKLLDFFFLPLLLHIFQCTVALRDSWTWQKSVLVIWEPFPRRSYWRVESLNRRLSVVWLIQADFRATMELLPLQIEHDKLKQEQFEMKSNLKQSRPNWNGTVPAASHLKRDTWPMVQIEFCVGSTEPGFDSAESNQKRSWFIFNLSKRMAGTWSWPDTDCT